MKKLKKIKRIIVSNFYPSRIPKNHFQNEKNQKSEAPFC